MLRRCSDVLHVKSKKNYIDRGITVCPSWVESYDVFAAWALANGYKDTLSLDRIKTDKGYSSTNCRWVNLSIQSRNRRKKLNTSSKYIGVSYKKDRNTYIAEVTVNNEHAFRKTFKTEIEAAKARDEFILCNNLDGFKLNFGT
jgi:hypothetical protein